MKNMNHNEDHGGQYVDHDLCASPPEYDEKVSMKMGLTYGDHHGNK